MKTLIQLGCAYLVGSRCVAFMDAGRVSPSPRRRSLRSRWEAGRGEVLRSTIFPFLSAIKCRVAAMFKIRALGLPLCLLGAIMITQNASAQAWKDFRVYDWKDLNLTNQLPGSRVILMDGISVLKVENTNHGPLDVSLLKITDPTIIRKTETVSCEMKYEDVRGVPVDRMKPFWADRQPVSGSLNLLKLVPPPAPGGDESTNTEHYDLAGTANWRPYSFASANQTTEGGLPLQLELRLSLPTNGTVYLRPVKLQKFVSGWWSQEQAGFIGGIGGSAIGCLAGLLGMLAGMGKARGFVLAMTRVFIGVGIVLTIAGLVAVAFKQPYAVWYTLILPGGILTLVFWVNLYPIKKRYDDMEIRRMTSVDTMGH